ncbi:hypothetical protein [Nocardia sp. NBC_00416]|uniref:hypothetical protein n=1 Tax=Nocardia sp. NBC_00416 TaxID=2975991 RepID=UPI002E216258
MGIFGFTWADGGSFVGGALGAAFLGPPGAMLGSAVGAYAGGVWGDDKGVGAAMEEALVAGIGAAGGAWAANLAGSLLKDHIAGAAARALSAGAARRVDSVAAKALLPWNSHHGGPLAALGGAFGGYEVSPQARTPVQISAAADIGNGGCPAQMSNLMMPAQLTGPVREMYEGLPRYLCDVWRSFGTGGRVAPPPAPALPEQLRGSSDSGIPEYTRKARRLDAMMEDFAALDREVAALARDSGRISGEGRAAVDVLIDTVNRRAGETPPAGTSRQVNALDLLNEAFEKGRQTLGAAVTAGDRVAADTNDLTDEIETLRKELDSHLREHPRADEPERTPPERTPEAPPVVPPPPLVPPALPPVPWPLPVCAPPRTEAPRQCPASIGRTQGGGPNSGDRGTADRTESPWTRWPAYRPGVAVESAAPATAAHHRTPWTPGPTTEQVVTVATRHSGAPVPASPEVFASAAWSVAVSLTGWSAEAARAFAGAALAAAPVASGLPVPGSTPTGVLPVPGRTPWSGIAHPVGVVPGSAWSLMTVRRPGPATENPERESMSIDSAGDYLFPVLDPAVLSCTQRGS